MSEISTAFDHIGDLTPESLLPPLPNFQVICDAAEIAEKFGLPKRVRFHGMARQASGRISLLFYDPQLPERGPFEIVPAMRRAPLGEKVQSIEERYVRPRG